MAEVRTEFTGDASSLASATKSAQEGIAGFLATTDKASASLGQMNQVVELAGKAQKGLTAASAFLATGTAAVTAAVKAQTLAFLASPMAPVAAAALALGAAYAYLSKEADEANKKVETSAKAAADAQRAMERLHDLRATIADAELIATGKATEADLKLRDTIQKVTEEYGPRIAAQQKALEAAQKEGKETAALEASLQGLRDRQGELYASVVKTDAATRAKTQADKDAAAAAKAAAAASKKKAEQDAEEARMLAENQARIAAINDEWDRQRATLYDAIDATKALSAQVTQLDETEEDRIAREYRETDALLKKQIATNKALGLSTAALEDARVMLKEKTKARYAALAQEEVDAQKEADKEIQESAKDTFDVVFSAASDIAGQLSYIVGEISGKLADAYQETQSQIDAIDGLLNDLSDSSVNYASLQGAALVSAYKDGEIAAEDLSSSQKTYLKSTLGAEQDALEKKAAAEKEAAQAAFDVTQGVAILQAIMGTAAGIMQAYAQLGPIGGTIAGIAITALGAAQVGLIASQKPSFAAGGFTDGMPTTGGNATLHPREAVLNQQGRSAIGDDAIRAANAGVYGAVVRPNRGQIVYKHRAFEYFVADHLGMNGSLARSIRKGDRIGQRRMGRG